MPSLDLNRIRKINDLVHTNKWTFEMISVPEPVSSLASVSPGDVLDPYTVTVDLPIIRISPLEVVHRGLSVNVPGSLELDKQVNVTFLESSMKIIKFFEVWRAMVSKIALPVSYSTSGSFQGLKGSFSLTMLNRQLKPAFTVVFEGVFVLSMELGQAVGDKGADVLRPNVSFSYDYFYYDL